MFPRIPRAWCIAVPLLCFSYLFGLTRTGLLGPDEPRYASIGREMARSGDWITPRLWGNPWFEKPALLYWMTGTAFRFGLGEDLAPRLPVALTGITFLIFFQWILRRQFGCRPAWYSTAILASSAGWLSFSHIGVTDLPMAAAFSASMLLSLPWLAKGETRWLPPAAALLGLAALAKGLVPLVLALPLAWAGRRRLANLVNVKIVGSFLVVAAPWYVLCYLRNGTPFLRDFFWEHHLERFTSESLRHQQPFWFYLPVLLAAMFPWDPLIVFLFRTGFYSDRSRSFLLISILFGFLFFSASTNKLPGYLLPLMPAAAALLGIALAEARNARLALAGTALLLVLVPVLIKVLPQALELGLSRSRAPSFEWIWMLPGVLSAIVWRLEASGRRNQALVLLSMAITVAVIAVKVLAFPAMDRAASARPIWREIESMRDRVCVEQMNRNFRYGLNYYSITPLPDCSENPGPIRLSR